MNGVITAADWHALALILQEWHPTGSDRGRILRSRPAEETLRPGTTRELKIEVPFGRSLSLDDALRLPLLLAYERNGEPFERRNGAPLRLIVPGWYGIANVKWLRRIEVRNRRYMGRYMGRDYVTVRGERHGNEVVFVESSVTRMNLKSVVARVTRRPTKDGKVSLKAYGAVWGDGTPLESRRQPDGSP
jgi:DMSO/TMAO reductase YedYZ molybdopterin-dependent catalytic subunit